MKPLIMLPFFPSSVFQYHTCEMLGWEWVYVWPDVFSGGSLVFENTRQRWNEVVECDTCNRSSTNCLSSFPFPLNNKKHEEISSFLFSRKFSEWLSKLLDVSITNLKCWRLSSPKLLQGLLRRLAVIFTPCPVRGQICRWDSHQCIVAYTLSVTQCARDGKRRWAASQKSPGPDENLRRQWWHSDRRSDLWWIISLLHGPDELGMLWEGAERPIQLNSFCFYFS